MKTILQPTELAYHAINFQDAVVMLPVMDELADKFQKSARFIENIRHNSHNFTEEEIINAEKEYHTIGNQCLVLTKLGFTPSIPGTIQFNTDDFPGAKELAS